MQAIHIGQGLRDRDWPRAIGAALSALLVGVLAFALAQTARLKTADARLDAVVQKAFYETCELTQSMSVNLRKLLVAGEAGRRQALLGDVALEAQGAMSNLALLPVGQETVSATMKFINQAGDYVGSLSAKLDGGGAMSEADEEALRRLSETAARFSSGLGRLLDRYEAGEDIFGGGETGEAPDLRPISDPAARYPALLYDGPFSDGRSQGVYKALEGLEALDEARARASLSAYLGPEAAIEYAGESTIPVPCYEYALNMGGYRLSAGVTRAGGRLLYLLCEGGVGAQAITADVAVASARDWLASRGYGDMTPSYSSAYGGVLTVNFAAVQDGVILYPDLVKVQVSLADGAVIGLEAAGYLMNHVPRRIEAPRLSQQEALARMGDRLTARSARLCVIPVNDGEALCYEITAEADGETYLAYIDAMNGLERELMQVIADENGALVM